MAGKTNGAAAAEDVVYALTINGKRVTLKRRLPMRDAPRLPALLQACGDGDYRTQTAVLQALVESWEFDGDPSDPASYEALDVFSEFVPLSDAIGRHLTARLGRDPKATSSQSARI